MEIRLARSEDYGAIVNLVNEVFGLDRGLEWALHVHKKNPAGESIMMVAEDRGEIVAYRSLVRTTAFIDGEPVRCAQLADASTRPDYRNRGLFTKLNASALDVFFADGGDMVFGFPGPMSYPIQIRKFGFAEAKPFAHLAYPIRFGRLGSRLLWPYHLVFGSRSRGCSILPADKALTNLLFRSDLRGLHFSRATDILRWRLTVPGRNYHVFALDSEDFAIVGRTRRRGIDAATIMDVAYTSRSRLRVLLSCISKWAITEQCGLVFGWVPPVNLATYLSAGYLPVPKHYTRLIFKPRYSSDTPRLLSAIADGHVALLDTDAY